MSRVRRSEWCAQATETILLRWRIGRGPSRGWVESLLQPSCRVPRQPVARAPRAGCSHPGSDPMGDGYLRRRPVIRARGVRRSRDGRPLRARAPDRGPDRLGRDRRSHVSCRRRIGPLRGGRTIPRRAPPLDARRRGRRRVDHQNRPTDRRPPVRRLESAHGPLRPTEEPGGRLRGARPVPGRAEPSFCRGFQRIILVAFA